MVGFAHMIDLICTLRGVEGAHLDLIYLLEWEEIYLGSVYVSTYIYK